MYGQNNGYFMPNYTPYIMQTNGAMPDALSQMKMPYQAQQTPAQKQTNDLIWVQGEAGAKGYLVAPNTTVVLWDTESATIYVKTADGTGIPSMRILDFTERATEGQKAHEKHVCKCGDKFVTKEQFEELKAKFEDYIEAQKEGAE